MCGVVGVLRFDRREVDPRVVERMARTLRHRGPDDEGFLHEPGIALAHRRLSIIDLATGHQPMTAGAHSVVFNGEIYNYVELRDELRAAGRTFRTTSDTEVLLQLYDACGPAFVQRLNGIFAFVLYDRARNVVLAARDHFGVKPLYHARAGDELLFASEIKAFWQHPAMRATADHDALHEYLTFQFVTGTGTLFEGVHKLPPAHCMEVDLASGAVRTWNYWSPRFGCDLRTPEAEVVERTRWLLEDAVRLQLRSDVPLGTYLSGGLDSSIVTALAARRTPIIAFTGRFPDGPAFDESDYAREVARHVAATLHEVVPTEDEFVDLLPRLVHHMDEPAAGPGLFPQFIVARLAAQHVKVVLGGQGGDEVFGGYVRYLLAYLEQALKGAIFETNEESRHIVSLASMVRNLPALREYAPMLQRFWEQGLFEGMDRRYFRLLDRSGGAMELLAPAYRDAYRPHEVFARFARVFNSPDTPSYFNRMTHFDLLTGLPALLQVEDRVSMANSLESRVPLLDHRLVDLVASLPARRKFAGGELKFLLKRAAGDVVPPRILARKDKMGFPVPLHRWVRGRSREFVHDMLLSPRARQRGLFDPCQVERLLATEPPFSRRVWGLLNLELWHRQFIDRPPSPDPS
jgi:asparagine synthase (glutamine-hydrolysing)